MKFNRWMTTAAMAALLSMGLCASMAQDQNQDSNRGNRGGDRGGDRGPRGFGDPAQMRERMLGMYKERLEITDDAEWKAISPLVQKVMDARMASFSGMRMFGGRRPGGDDNGGDRGPRGPFGQSNPDADTLQKAVDGKASSTELKAALAKYQESRKTKQAELEKAQAALRGVLSVRQEAIATLAGLL